MCQQVGAKRKKKKISGNNEALKEREMRLVQHGEASLGGSPTRSRHEQQGRSSMILSAFLREHLADERQLVH